MFLKAHVTPCTACWDTLYLSAPFLYIFIESFAHIENDEYKHWWNSALVIVLELSF